MEVREATVEDLEEICALIRELAAYEHLEDEVELDAEAVRRHLFGDAPVARVLLADVSGQVAGMALWFPTFSTFLGRPGIWLEDLFVRPPFRHRGIGRAMLDRLRSLTTDRIEWRVLDWNQPAVDLYRRLGAQPVEGWTTYRWLPPPTDPPEVRPPGPA